jgi:dUTP pyrophosphatase
MICNINIEKSTLALAIEKDYGIEWGFNQSSPFDPYFFLRACIVNPVTIDPGEVVPIPTGIYPQLLDPNFVIEVGTDYDLLCEQGLSIIDSPMLFDYTFRNEIWVLIKNNFKEAQVIAPTKKLATFSVRQLPQMVINYVDQIEETPWNFKTSKKFIQEIKKKTYPDIYNIKKEKVAEFYSREDIMNYVRKHNGS